MRIRLTRPFSPNGYEAVLASDTDWPWASAFSAASLAVRISSGKLDEHYSAIVKVAAGVAAPLLADFVLWALRRAAELRLDHLYFLARDGEQLLRVARLVAPIVGPPITMSYLQVSRLTLNLAASLEVSQESLRWLLARIHRMSPSEFSDRLRLDEAGARRIFDSASIRVDDWNRPFGRTAGLAILSSLADPRPASILADSAREIRSRTLPYLQQEGVFSDGSIGVVDVGGAGSQVWALNQLRAELELPPVHGFFLARYRNASLHQARPEYSEPTIDSYLFDEVTGDGIERYSSVMSLVDAFCAPSHGRVLDYDRVSSTWAPKFAPFDASAVSEWGLPTLVNTVERAVLVATTLSRTHHPSQGVPKSVLSNLRRFVTRPTTSEARAWGSLPVSDMGARQLATAISWRDLGRLASDSSPSPGVRHWWTGSRQQSTLPVRITTRVGATLTRSRNR